MKQPVITSFRSDLQNDRKSSSVLLSCLLFLCVLFLVFSDTTTAATYYLDAVNGNNSNPGTSEQPWQTMTKVGTTAQAGDTIIIKRVHENTFAASWPEGLKYRSPGVTQFGITWTFDHDYPVGRFANGDFWVVGPVKIIGINPPSKAGLDSTNPGRIKNGSMINPSPVNPKQGYDSSMVANTYDSELNVAFNVSAGNPLFLQAHSSLISSISVEEAGHRPQLQTAAVLTILDNPAPDGSFRPPYCGSDKSIRFNKNQLNFSVLDNLPPVSRCPDLATVERYFERPWIDHQAGYGARNQHPQDNMPDYGREISMQIGIGSLMLHLRFTNQQKETLLIRYVQLGIDFYGILQDGGKNNWPADGGHASGRKWPILFAGLVLNDLNMESIGEKSGDYLYHGSYGPGHLPADYIHFGEDDQTFYVTKHPDAAPPPGNTEYDIYMPPYNIHGYHDIYQAGTVTVTKGSPIATGSSTKWTTVPKNSGEFGVSGDIETYKVNGKSYDVNSVIDDTHLVLKEPYRGYPEDTNGTIYSEKSYILSDFVYYGHGQKTNYLEAEEYVNTDVNLPEWGILYATDPSMANKQWTAPYRECCTANSWAGFVLAAHIMQAKSLWNHNALFDYMDRYMQVEKQRGNAGTYLRQWDRFTEDMWDTYRPGFEDVWGNHAPVFDPIGNKTVAAGSVLTFTVRATDADGDTLIYWASDLPQGAAFDHVTKTFTWTPTKSQIGTYKVTFKVRDATLITAETITITVGKLITVPTDANSIQKAINLADTGDTIAVEQGRYRENINFNNKNIVLKSTNPDNPGIAANTIIDGNGAGSVVTFSSSVPALIDTSMSFSTSANDANSWSMTKSGDVVALSFGNIEIDYTDPAPDSVISDKISLPPMILTDITVETISGFGDVYEATLNPIAGSMLTVTSDIDETTKMTAYVGIGGIMIAGTTWVAFSTSNNDLTNINATTPGYSAVINNMAGTGGNRTVDFSMGGTSGTQLSTLLGSAGGTASGTLSGQINATSSANDAACEIAGFTITGGNAMQGGGIYIDSVCPTVEKNIITANNAVEGGGIYCRDSSAIIRLNKITGNKTAFGTGGAICGVNSSATVANNLIADNTAYYGSGILWFNGKPTLVNNTIAYNTSTLNSFTCGIAVDLGEPSSFIKNNIIAFNNNGTGIYGLSELAPASFTYNNVFANSTGNYGGKLTDQTGRNGNISADPFFFDTYNKDFHLKSSAGRWDANSQSWLTDTVTSPCIDAGDPNDNFADELWSHGRRINMGAYGGTSQASMSESDTGSIADLNNDGIVDYVDMAIFTQKWLSNETSLHEDLNHDGIVDFKDFAILSIQ